MSLYTKGNSPETFSLIVRAAPVVSTAIYAVGDQVGGLMTFNVGRFSGQGGVIISASVVDQSKQNPDLDLFLFSSEPTISSSDNAALNISFEEMSQKLIGRIRLDGSYSELSAISTMTKDDFTMPIRCAANSKDIYGILMAQSTPDFVDIDDLEIILGILQD